MISANLFSLRTILGFLAGLALLSAPLHQGFAQSYPKGAITLVISQATGDATDIAGRAMAEELSKLLRVSVVPINRAGAGGAVGTESVVKAPKDGQTILLANNASLTYRRVLEPENVSYDPARDLTPLGVSTRIPSIVAVRGDAPFKTLGEALAYSKANPGMLRVGTVGAGSVGDFTVQMINTLTGANFIMVPFKGAAPGVAALLGEHVEGVAVALGAIAGQLKSGALRGIAISTRFPDFPAVPTMFEMGHAQNIPGVWFAFFAPAAISPEVNYTLVSALERVIKDPAIAAKLLTLGMVQDYGSPEKLLAELRDEHLAVEQLARRAGLVK